MKKFIELILVIFTKDEEFDYIESNLRVLKKENIFLKGVIQSENQY